MPLLLFAYRTAVHTSTDISPFLLMFSRQPNLVAGQQLAHDPSSYQAKIADFQDLLMPTLLKLLIIRSNIMIIAPV